MQRPFEYEPTPAESEAVNRARNEGGFIPHEEFVQSVQDDKGRWVPIGADGSPISYDAIESYAKTCPPPSEWYRVNQLRWAHWVPIGADGNPPTEWHRVSRFRWLWILIPLLVGGVFFYAAIMKSLSVGEFTRETNRITFLPHVLVNILPVIVPPMECLLACLVAIPHTRRLGMQLCCGAMCGFVLYFWWRIASGIDAPCYCFGPPMYANQLKLHNNLFGVWRNIVMIVLTVAWLYANRPPPKERTDATLH